MRKAEGDRRDACRYGARHMNPARALIRDHRLFALVVVLLALFAKFLVPQGYMLADSGHKLLTVEMCLDGIEHRSITLAIPMDSQHRQGSQNDGAKGDAKCPYSALGMGALGGADAVQLGLAIAFILALGFAATRPIRLRRILHLRPPLRGPPALV